MGEVIAIVAILCVFGIPIIAILSEHRRKMAEMGMGHGAANASLLNELRDLKRQMEEVRDTTTRYDLSFDTALQRLESRMTHMEEQFSNPARKIAEVENQVESRRS